MSCSQCDYDSESGEELRKHIQRGIHNSENHVGFMCEHCNFQFKNETLRTNHLANMHSRNNEETENPTEKEKDDDQNVLESTFLCGQCDLCFSSLEECLGHVDAHMFQC